MTCCPETRRRIRAAVAAWAYEVHSDPLMSDEEFDTLLRDIDPTHPTASPEMDAWFEEHFEPHTSMWVQKHPDKAGLERIYRTLRPHQATWPIWILAP